MSIMIQGRKETNNRKVNRFMLAHDKEKRELGARDPISQDVSREALFNWVAFNRPKGRNYTKQAKEQMKQPSDGRMLRMFKEPRSSIS